jgi:UTP---glucose-1-phosphate uridylyltransferase
MISRKKKSKDCFFFRFTPNLRLMAHRLSEEQLPPLEILAQELSTASEDLRHKVLDSIPAVIAHRVSWQGLSSEEALVLKQVAAIGQADIVLDGERSEDFYRLLERLIEMDRFYREIGGIVGYQAKVLSLIAQEEKGAPAVYHAPSFIDISEETAAVKEEIQWGLEAMPEMAEIYPLGGAADRLHLVDEKNGQELPAAKLPFAGHMLLEHLVRDLDAREKLYYKTFGKEVVTPIAIMTSHEKQNHRHVLQICEEKRWFDRPKEMFRFFVQPLVPMVDIRGNWCMQGALRPLFKPGGHGAIWKMAQDSGVFDWLHRLGKKCTLVRQINNPIAGLDYGLLAFTGIGWKKEMKFGFASCPRLVKSAEGVNVLKEQEGKIALTNIEYCDLAKFGIEDSPLKAGEPYSRFSSNTNILFANLAALKKAVKAMPFPGLILNLKKTAFVDAEGKKREQVLGRLESTMQNIADVFTEPKKEGLKTKSTYLTYNVRSKTISTAKKAYVPGGPLMETPENCFYDLLQENRHLLEQCGWQLPPSRTIEEYLRLGPAALFLYQPTLGPLYSLIREKIGQGHLAMGSELLLEIADVTLRNLHLNGSLQIIAENSASCILENVTIENQGVDWSASAPFWRMGLKRRETVKIILKGTGRLMARNKTLKGNQLFVVESGKTVTI